MVRHKILEQTVSGQEITTSQLVPIYSSVHNWGRLKHAEQVAFQFRVEAEDLDGGALDFYFYAQDNLVHNANILATPTPNEWMSTLLQGVENASAGFSVGVTTDGTVFRYMSRLWVPANTFRLALPVVNNGAAITPTLRFEAWIHE